MEKFLEKNDVFVSGSYFECFPVTILEAMSHGLPIISMDTSGELEVLSLTQVAAMYVKIR
ncbi:glycosyltransferase [Salmonella enterica]|uniref:glycosyltransferase n=1 Tax=Salmonella enterica TaxID=28901 RepID=UPI001F06030D|nr:glycosyltransferase [Salmonella enterica]